MTPDETSRIEHRQQDVIHKQNYIAEDIHGNEEYNDLVSK